MDTKAFGRKARSNNKRISGWYESFSDIKHRQTLESTFKDSRRKSGGTQHISKHSHSLSKRNSRKATVGKRYPTFTLPRNPASVALVDHCFVVYITDGPVAKRRFADFLWLERCLRLAFPCVPLPYLPPPIGSFFFRNPTDEHKTRETLERFIRIVLATPFLRESVPFVNFVAKKSSFKASKNKIESQIRSCSKEDILKRYEKLFPRAFALARAEKSSVDHIEKRVGRLKAFLLNEKEVSSSISEATKNIAEAYRGLVSPAKEFAKAERARNSLQRAIAGHLGLELDIQSSKFMQRKFNLWPDAVKRTALSWKTRMGEHFDWEELQPNPLLHAIKQHEELVSSYRKAEAMYTKLSAGQSLKAIATKAELGTLISLLRVTTTLILRMGSRDLWRNRSLRFQHKMQRFIRQQHKDESMYVKMWGAGGDSTSSGPTAAVGKTRTDEKAGLSDVSLSEGEEDVMILFEMISQDVDTKIQPSRESRLSQYGSVALVREPESNPGSPKSGTGASPRLKTRSRSMSSYRQPTTQHIH